jgi:hypothetical protein
MVPTGDPRIVQVIGIRDPTKKLCVNSVPIGDTLARLNEVNESYDISLYEIGKTIENISQDTEVYVADTYSQLSSAEQILRDANCRNMINRTNTDSTSNPVEFTHVFDFATASEYTYDATKIEISDGVCKLLPINQIDNNNTSDGFDGATHSGTMWKYSASTVALKETQLIRLRFDETVNSVSFADSTGNNPNSTCSNDTCPASGEEGVSNKAVSFTGANDFITVPQISSSISNFTISAWVYFNSLPSSDIAIFNPDDWETGKLKLQLTSNGYVGVCIYGNKTVGGSDYCPTTTNALTINNWHHVVIIYDSNNKTLKIYLNNDTGETFTFGTAEAAILGPGKFLGGWWKLDEFAVWPRSLTASEVDRLHSLQPLSYSGYFLSSIMDASSSTSWKTLSWTPTRPMLKELPNATTPESAYLEGNITDTPIALWRMNGGVGSISDGTVVFDSSGNGYNLTAKNTNNTGMAYVNAKLNQGINFDGVDDWVQIDYNSNLFPTTFTVETWAKITQDPGALYYLIDGSVTGNLAGYSLYASSGSTSHWSAALADTNNSWQTLTGRAVLRDEWVHLALTYNGTTARLYNNGVLTDEKSFTYTLPSSNAPIYIGGSNYSGGGYYNFPGIIDETAIYNSALDGSQILDHYKRGALRLKFQVHSCSSSSCGGVAWGGSGGSDSTYFSEEMNSEAGLPSLAMTLVSNARYFQYKTFFETDDDTYSPGLGAVSIGPPHYDQNAPTVVNATGVNYVTLLTFTETLGAKNSGSIKYQISPDGTTWYYYNVSSWSVATTSPNDTNSATEIENNILNFPSEVSTGSFFFKAFLFSNGTQAVELDALTITGTRSE